MGLDGEVIQCIPIDEVAYANAPRNDDTLSIEVCHPDDTGKFNDASYELVVKLTAWLCKQLKLKVPMWSVIMILMENSARSIM